MGGSGESVDAETEDGGKQGELSSHHGHHLWTFFTAGEQMKWNQTEREGRRWEMESGGGGGGAVHSVGGGDGEGGRTSCQVSPHFKLSCVSAITVSAAHNHGAVGERRTDLQIKHCHITRRR